MNEFDQFIKHKIKMKYYIRYADDFVALSEDKSYLYNLIFITEVLLQKELKLELHQNKIFIKTFTSGVDFLGWVNFPDHWILRTSTKRRMLKRIKESRKPETITSYLGLLKHGNTYKIREILINL